MLREEENERYVSPAVGTCSNSMYYKSIEPNQPPHELHIPWNASLYSYTVLPRSTPKN
jgi:hypothetical protein